MKTQQIIREPNTSHLYKRTTEEEVDHVAEHHYGLELYTDVKLNPESGIQGRSLGLKI